MDRAKREEACASAHTKLEQFADGWRFYELDGQGERRWQTEAERATAEARWRKEVEAWCKDQPAGGGVPARARPPRGQPVP